MSNTPRAISIYAITAGAPERVAVFTWRPGGEVALTVTDPRWGKLARAYYEEGIPDHASLRVIERYDGAAFMAALAELPMGSYCYSVVEE